MGMNRVLPIIEITYTVLSKGDKEGSGQWNSVISAFLCFNEAERPYRSCFSAALLTL